MVVAVIMTIYSLRDYLINVLWNLYVAKISDEKLEKAIREQYTSYEQDNRSVSMDGLNWLLEQSRYFTRVWSDKCDKSSLLSSEKIDKYLALLEFWKRAEDNILSEINRRKYFNM